MHGTATGQAAPDLFGHQRQQRCRHAAHGFEGGVQRIEGVDVLVKEALAAAPDIPVGEHVQVAAQLVAGTGDVVAVQAGGDLADQVTRVRHQVLVKGVGVTVIAQLGLVSLPSVGGIGVQGEEAVHVPQRQDDLADAVADALFGDDQVPATEDGAGHEEPAHGVRTVAVQDFGDVRVIAQALGHLLSVGAQDDAVADDIAERRTVEQGRGQDVEHVEPATRLADVLHDEVGGVVGVEPFLVLERIVHLPVRHGTGVEPDIQHVFDAAHGGLARGIVRVGTGQFIDEGPVQVHLSFVVDRQAAEIGFEVGQRTVNVGARVLGVVRLPHRDG
ncbi:hypothetical protein PJL18_01522 [Paenarthrobacter nicotinovorans]|nr:hypothetical protein [Paenarthrobacter nicotinovorans]